MSFSHLMNPAGGLRYHARAMRHSATLWAPFRWALGEWLVAWRPATTTLALVGPSGGYNLQLAWLESFERVLAFEPDPLARAILRTRVRRQLFERPPRLEFVADDCLIAEPDRLAARLASEGPTALLFTNILGQLRALTGARTADAPELARVREGVRAALDGRPWASFHDRYSGWIPTKFAQGATFPQQLPRAELMRLAYPTEPDGEDALTDHFTEGALLAGLPCAYFDWELEPGLHHLIEAVRSAP